MTFTKLVDKYKQQIVICSQIDYADKKTVKANNKAVDTMYKLVERLGTDFGPEQIREFAKLLDSKEHNTNIWAATQMLERLTLDKDLEKKALAIIRETAEGNSLEALGFKVWLQNWKAKG